MRWFPISRDSALTLERDYVYWLVWARGSVDWLPSYSRKLVLAALRKICFQFFSDFFPIKILHFSSFKPLLGNISIIIVASVKKLTQGKWFFNPGNFSEANFATFSHFFPVSHLEKSRFRRVLMLIDQFGGHIWHHTTWFDIKWYCTMSYDII